MFSALDHQYMSQALRLAAHGLYTTDPNPRVGCVIVRDGQVVGEGWHEQAGEAHAEVNALRQAAEQVRGATVYVTLEPCSHHGRTPPCADALIDAGVARVVVAMQDPSPKVAGQGMARLKAAGILVECGLLQAEAEALNLGFVSRFTRQRPFVRCKVATSLDGRTAMVSGESKWITSAAAREDVQRLRARSSVIVTGIETVLADDPRMNARVDAEVRQPDRVVLDSELRTPARAAILKQTGLTWLAHASGDAERQRVLQQAGARLLDLPAAAGRIDLTALMKALMELDYNEILVEAGASVSGAFLQAGLVDELIIYLAPHLMGDSARPMFQLPGLANMAERMPLSLMDVRAVGDDLRLCYRPADN